MGFVQIPGATGLTAALGAKILTAEWCKPKLPDSNGFVADFETTLQEKLRDITEPELVSQASENRERDDISRKLEIVEG